MDAEVTDPTTLVVHELRSPLAYLATAAHALGEECPPDLRPRCDAMEKAALRLLRVTESVLEVAGTLARDQERCAYDPVQVVTRLLEDHRSLGSRVVTSQTASLRESRAWGRAAVFESLVHSLLNNAADHGPLDGTAVMRLAIVDHELSVEIENRVDPARRHRGLGLGTVVCERLATACGATLHYETVIDRYVATIRLPLLPLAQEARSPRREPSRARLRQLQAAAASA